VQSSEIALLQVLNRQSSFLACHYHTWALSLLSLTSPALHAPTHARTHWLTHSHTHTHTHTHSYKPSELLLVDGKVPVVSSLCLPSSSSCSPLRHHRSAVRQTHNHHS
jgi:hypothetical protein